MSDHEIQVSNSLSGKIWTHTEVKAERCYQCGKCSAGCPVVDQMDYPPSLVMRMLQTDEPNNYDKLLKSMSIWLCVSCEMCLTRCPMEIDIPALMDNMRQKSVRAKKTNLQAKKIISFHKSFLDSINYTGRLYEMGMVVDYKMRTGAMTQDVTVAPKMFMKGKLNPVPEIIKGRKKIAAIFNKVQMKKEEGKL